MKQLSFVIKFSALLILCTLCIDLHAQSFKEIRIPHELCSGKDFMVRFGTESWNEVVVLSMENTLGHSDTIFLPDGVPCNNNCAYESPVTFTAFRPTDTITSAEDIKYLRINMEHSYIGDIYINITCPNGQRAHILRFAGTGSSDCTNAIPNNARGWLDGNNVMEACMLGGAYDNENPDDPCNPKAYGNRPGNGWNYCWSNNTSAGYQYASGDGILYRNAHSHNGHIDSSNVALGTNYYHPDQNFSNLVGCPLNGTWKVLVIDGFSADNGYIFEWELSLNEKLLPDIDCYPKAYFLTGGDVEQYNDTSFIIHSPKDITADTTITYFLRMITTCGDTVDTSTTITYHPAPHSYMEASVCKGDGYTIGGQTVYGEGQHDIIIPTTSGCDSTIHLALTEYPTYSTYVSDSTCPNDPYHFEGNIYTEEGDYPHHYSTIYGCDSTITLHLSITDGNIRALIKAIPQVFDDEHTTVHLYDRSLNNVSHRWMIAEASGYDSEPELEFEYPMALDSMIVALEALSPKGCADTDTVVLRLDRSWVSTANIFTPDLADNNQWSPALHDVVEAETWIYDRAGRLVAHLESQEATWDGSLPNGGRAPQGSYVYTIHYRTRVRPERKMVRTGQLTLIR